MFRLATLIVFLLTAVLGDHVEEEILRILNSAASQIAEQSTAHLTNHNMAERDSAFEMEKVILFWKWFWQFETFWKWLRLLSFPKHFKRFQILFSWHTMINYVFKQSSQSQAAAKLQGEFFDLKLKSDLMIKSLLRQLKQAGNFWFSNFPSYY